MSIGEVIEDVLVKNGSMVVKITQDRRTNKEVQSCYVSPFKFHRPQDFEIHYHSLLKKISILKLKVSQKV